MTRRRPAARLLVGATALALVAPPALAAPSLPYRVVVMQGLDKVTARVSPIEAPIGQDVAFGTLKIVARSCLETPPTEAPESAAFLEIRTVEPGEPERTEFVGWMLASSPALSALEHPIYDVWVIDCKDPLNPEPPPPATSP
jgi:hypothetical protein